MNIYAKEGDKVIFCNPNSGYPSDRNLCNRLLILDDVYTIDFTIVGDSYTEVYLKEFYGVAFNSVMFEDYEEPLPAVENGSCDGMGCGRNQINIDHLCFCDEHTAMANEYQRVTGKEWQLKSGGNWQDPECRAWDYAWRFLWKRIQDKNNT